MCFPLIIVEILFPSIQITNVRIFHASTIQSGLQSKLKPMIEEAVASLLKDDGVTANAYCGGMAIADLGCSSGPNTLVLVSTAVDAVRRRCSELQQQPPELCIHLSDLPSNDFNLVIRSLATYIKTQESFSPPVLTSIVPGSFHGRLFNKSSLHLVCSTASLHWLSKVSIYLFFFYIRSFFLDCINRPENITLTGT